MYDYQTEKPKLFTEDGVKLILQIRSRIDHACAIAGCVTREKALGPGDSWLSMAAQDFLEECGYVTILRGPGVPGQYETIRLLRGGA